MAAEGPANRRITRIKTVDKNNPRNNNNPEYAWYRANFKNEEDIKQWEKRYDKLKEDAIKSSRLLVGHIGRTLRTVQAFGTPDEQDEVKKKFEGYIQRPQEDEE